MEKYNDIAMYCPTQKVLALPGLQSTSLVDDVPQTAAATILTTMRRLAGQRNVPVFRWQRILNPGRSCGLHCGLHWQPSPATAMSSQLPRLGMIVWWCRHPPRLLSVVGDLSTISIPHLPPHGILGSCSIAIQDLMSWNVPHSYRTNSCLAFTKQALSLLTTTPLDPD